MASSKGQDISIVDTLEAHNEGKNRLVEQIIDLKTRLTLLREKLVMSDSKIMSNTIAKEIREELVKLKESKKSFRLKERKLEKLTKLNFETSVYGKWMLETIGSGIAMSKYHTQALEGKAAHLYKGNMERLHLTWREYATKDDNQNWRAIIYSFQTIWREMTFEGIFKPNAETRNFFYGFRQVLHNFTGGIYHSSHGAFKVHLLEHCYDFMAYYKCSLRCLDETNQESFHKRANMVHNRSTKYNKNRIIQEKRFLELLDSQSNPAFYTKNVQKDK